jgi:hypothetical protein
LATAGEAGSDATVGLTGVAVVLTGGAVTAGFAAGGDTATGLVIADAANSGSISGLTGTAAVLTGGVVVSGLVTADFEATGGTAVP